MLALLMQEVRVGPCAEPLLLVSAANAADWSPPPSRQPFTLVCVVCARQRSQGRTYGPFGFAGWRLRADPALGQKVITHRCQAERGCLSVALEELVFHLIYTSNQAN